MIGIQKIQAGALQLVLFVGAIIAVLLLSFVLLSYAHGLFHKKTDITVEVIQAAHQGLRHSLRPDFNTANTAYTPTENPLGIATTVETTYWGLLQIRKAMAKKGTFQFERWAFVGHSNPELPAVYLKDNQFPLVLAGNTRITGTAYLPERGVKMGTIYGNSYQETQLIFGKEIKSAPQLPKFPIAMDVQLQQITAPHGVWKGEAIDYKKGMVIKNSFSAPTKIITGETLFLDETTLTGNILVWASQEIVVAASSQLKDVVLIAPRIQTRDGVKGSFQALARKSIHIGTGSQLEYPSLLAVYQEQEAPIDVQYWRPSITLESYAQVRGMLVYLSKGELNRYIPHIRIAENARVHGEVFCDQNLELKGAVYGNVTTNGFIALENGNSYQNHLYNGTINSTLLPLEYGGLCYADGHMNQILKWLY